MWRLSPNLPKTARGLSHHVNVLHLTCRSCASSPKDSSKPSDAQNASSHHPPPPPPPPPQPPHPEKSGGIFWKLVGLSLVGAGGVVGYAWYDSSFRRKVQENIPYSKTAFDYFFNTLPSSPGSEKVPVSQTLPAPSLPSKVSKVKDESAVTPSAPAIQSHSSTESTATETDEEIKKRLQKEKTEEAIRQKEREEAAAHTELESQLKNHLAESKIAVEAALSSLSSATAAIKDHNAELRRAVDEYALDDQSQSAPDTSVFKPESVWFSEIDAERARNAVEKLKSAIDGGKANAVTARNSMIVACEEELNKMNYKLSTALAQLSKAQSESKVIAEYQNVIRKGKEQFRKELESVLPDVKITQRLRDGQLSEDELNSLIAHAHRRIEQLQKQLVDYKEAEQQRLEAALRQQSDENEKLAVEQIDREREYLKANLSVSKQKWEDEARVRLEREMRSQLARQAAVHSEHLTEVLRVQKRELEALFGVLLATRLDEERTKFQRHIIGWIARMRGIEKALADRADIEATARRSQELWLACQTLQSVLRSTGDADFSKSWEERLKPLLPEISAITSAAPDDVPLMTAVMSSLSAVALSRGVWTEESLIERFARVNTVARRVAFVSEGNPSLFRYALSYFLSFFVFRQPVSQDIDAEIPVDNLTPFVLLDRAEESLERGNLELAVRFVNQLTGEPRRIAADWLREARLLLETRQVADVLLAYATATNLGSLG